MTIHYPHSRYRDKPISAADDNTADTTLTAN